MGSFQIIFSIALHDGMNLPKKFLVIITYLI